MPRLVIVGTAIPTAVFDLAGHALGADTGGPMLRQNLATTFTDRGAHLPLSAGAQARLAEAEEVLQETFLRLCQHLAADGEQANLRLDLSWRITCDEHRRRKQRPSQSLRCAARPFRRSARRT
jgi:hypothetical protein